MGSQLADARVVRFNRSIGARLHDRSFHDRQHERPDVSRVGEPGFANTCLDDVSPGGEVLGDKRMRGNIFGVEFEREAANGTTVLAVGGHQALPIAFEQAEDALDSAARPRRSSSATNSSSQETLQVYFSSTSASRIVTSVRRWLSDSRDSGRALPVICLSSWARSRAPVAVSSSILTRRSPREG